MSKCRWTVHLQDGAHTVDLEHGYWSGKRRIFVDGRLVHVGDGFFLKVWALGSSDVVSVGGYKCEVGVKPNFRTNRYDYALMIGGEVFQPGECGPSSGVADGWVRRPDRTAFSSLMAKIEAQGFYRYTPPDHLESVKAETLRDESLFGPDNGRAHHADAEELCEGGIGRFLNELAPLLSKMGVMAPVVSEDFTIGGAYTVTVNGQTFHIYSQEQLAAGKWWVLSANRTVDILDSLLHEAGCNERAFQLYGGNDLFIVFLTPDMYRTIMESAAIAQSEKPVKRSAS